jgi:ribonuclease HII
MDLYEFDSEYRKLGYKSIAGIDEAGRGPLAGPVVAAAAIVPEGVAFKGLNDSKKVSAKNRHRLFYEILSSDAAFSVGISDIEEIETHNILGATRLAMQKAVNGLNQEPDFLLIDAVSLTDILKFPQEPIIKGDSKSASIAAASIVAKFVRDSLMIKLHDTYPEYGFDKHKGYGTKAHIEAIRKLGPCPIHRRGFIKNFWQEENLKLF